MRFPFFRSLGGAVALAGLLSLPILAVEETGPQTLGRPPENNAVRQALQVLSEQGDAETRAQAQKMLSNLDRPVAPRGVKPAAKPAEAAQPPRLDAEPMAIPPEARLHHLRAALEHLHAAGLPQLAEAIARQAEQGEAPQALLAQPPHELEQQLQQTRQELQELRRQTAELQELIRKSQPAAKVVAKPAPELLEKRTPPREPESTPDDEEGESKGRNDK